MAKKIISQKHFLEELIENKELISVYLINGIKLEGYITHFDDEAVFLYGKFDHQMIFKKNISTITTAAILND